MYCQIMHTIVIIYQTFNAKVVLNTILSNQFLTYFYDTKIFQILYSSYYKLKEELMVSSFHLTKVFNQISSIYVKICLNFKLDFG